MVTNYKRIGRTSNYFHGHSLNKKSSHIYQLWSGMRSRCDYSGRKNSKYYFEKKITYCPEWKDFRNFLKDMGDTYKEGLSLDRIDNTKGYFKENCRWATVKEQARNKSNTRLFKGKTLSEWSEILGVKRGTLAVRYYDYHWSIDRVLTPLTRKSPRKKSVLVWNV